MKDVDGAITHEAKEMEERGGTGVGQLGPGQATGGPGLGLAGWRG